MPMNYAWSVLKTVPDPLTTAAQQAGYKEPQEQPVQPAQPAEGTQPPAVAPGQPAPPAAPPPPPPPAPAGGQPCTACGGTGKV